MDLDHPKPLSLAAKDLARYRAVYGAKPVVGLREAMNRYLAGRADADSAKNLSPYRGLLAGRFVVISINPGLMGGDWVIVQFRAHPQAQYQAWVYRLSGVTPSVREFREWPCTAAEQRWIAATYAQLLALPDDI